MVSNIKRMRYVSENLTSSEDESSDQQYFAEVRNGTSSKNNDYLYEPNFQDANLHERRSRKPRCLSKNALLARENRLKKKMYVRKLEQEVSSLKSDNKKLATVVKNQSLFVADLKKEVKYLKSVISNSGDIKNLIRNIHSCAGMSVTSSLDSNLRLTNISVPKNTLTPSESDFITTPDCLLGNDLDFNLNLYEDISNFPSLFPDDISNVMLTPDMSSLKDHNYTSASNEEEDDVGVCLHVSKHNVSLEFCMNCNENAQESRKQL
ncbi:unnamed protein product [Phyllotreta striolata]|uniref:BZIP domain-containing protein n=1 Tax=Phyllotreta striolata TaxID=444603 RepID=A0A9N9TSB1_PHYSR|nr:unnamed protein product [Phyllotreta striolata]